MICQNMCVFSGRVGRDPEEVSVGEAKVLKFSLAIDSPKKNDDGTWDSNTSWADLEYWENAESTIGNRVRKITKGDIVAVHCQYRTKKKETENGNRTYHSFRVNNVFLENKPKKVEEDGMPYE